MVAFLAAPALIETAVGRVALNVLAKEFAKHGGTAFMKKFGKTTLQALTGGTAGAITYDQTVNKSSIPQSSMPEATRMEQMDASMAVPDLYKDTGINKSVAETGLGLDIGDKGEKEKERARIAKENKELMKGSPAPVIKSWEESYPDLSGKIADSSPPPSTPESIEVPQESFPDQSKEFSKPIIYNKDDVKKQTDKLVPEKVELGPLSAVDKQTAIALKGEKPDYYSNVVKAIIDSKQSKMSKEQWKNIIDANSTKDEIKYLGLSESLEGKGIITKEDLLSEIKFKDVASNMTVTTIPEDEMVDGFDSYSLGFEREGSKKMNVYQIDLPPETAADLEFNLGKKIYQARPAHVKEKYGRNQFMHTRTQIGYGDPDAPPADLEEKGKEIAEKLKNTNIVDEVQFEWVQDIQHFGTKDKPAWTAMKGSDITPEFIEKKYGNKYQLRVEKYQTQKDLLENTGLSTNKVLYVNRSNVGNPTRRNLDVLKRIEDDKFYVFSKKKLEEKASTFSTLEAAQEVVESVVIPDFPVKQSNKMIRLALMTEIKNAALQGLDSIAITNGNIQFNRSKEKGNKIHYDEGVLGQLKKIAKKYKLELDFIPIEPDKYLKLQDKLKKLKSSGYEETMLTREELFQYIRDNTVHGPSRSVVQLPDFRELHTDYNSTPYRGERFDETIIAMPLESRFVLFKNSKTGKIDFNMPVVQEKSMLKYGKTLREYLEGFQQWAEERGEVIIKMPLSKQLLKDSLSDSIRFSKLKTQGTTATA